MAKLAISSLVGLLFLLSACTTETTSDIDEVVWFDGDSGEVDGTAFRLANVDAPEIGSAVCENERRLGQEAQSFMNALTDNADDITITTRDDEDRYGRLVVDIVADDVDVSEAGLAEGVLRDWPHSNGVALAPKPDWCS